MTGRLPMMAEQDREDDSGVEEMEDRECVNKPRPT
jgi:hypothetical protein